MKKIYFAILAVSFSVFAVNPELEVIFKKYESTLMNFKTGMQSVSDIESTEFEIAQDGSMTSKIIKSHVISIILKVEDKKTYEYVATKEIPSGEVKVAVHLNDHEFDPNNQTNIKNIKIVNHILSGNFDGRFDDEYSSYSFRGSFTKNLLASMFCDLTNDVKGEYTDLSTGKVFPMKENQINRCNRVMEIAEIKKIDLSEIEFCDYTLPDGPESVCEIRDMSFLTSNL